MRKLEVGGAIAPLHKYPKERRIIMSNPESGYKPSEEEIVKAEEMMSPYEQLLSVERKGQFDEKAQELLIDTLNMSKDEARMIMEKVNEDLKEKMEPIKNQVEYGLSLQPEIKDNMLDFVHEQIGLSNMFKPEGIIKEEYANLGGYAQYLRNTLRGLETNPKITTQLGGKRAAFGELFMGMIDFPTLSNNEQDDLYDFLAGIKEK